MVDDIIVHNRSKLHDVGAASLSYSLTRADGGGSGSGEGYFTEGDGSGRGNGYSSGKGYNHGAGYGFRDSPFVKSLLSTPLRWANEGLMPQREDGAILVWKSVKWVAARSAWQGDYDWLYTVGQRYNRRGLKVMPGPISALRQTYWGGYKRQVPHVMAIWAHQLLAYKGCKAEHLAWEGTPAAVYAAPDYDWNHPNCSIARVESNGTIDPLSVIRVEQEPFQDGKRVFYPPYRYKTKRTALQK